MKRQVEELEKGRSFDENLPFFGRGYCHFAMSIIGFADDFAVDVVLVVANRASG